jgi:hypothetical protein
MRTVAQDCVQTKLPFECQKMIMIDKIRLLKNHFQILRSKADLIDNGNLLVFYD